MLSDHRLNKEIFTIYMMGNSAFDDAHNVPFEKGPYALGNITMRKNNKVAYVSVPNRQMTAIWQAVAAGGLEYLLVSIRDLGRGKLNVERVSFQDFVDPDDY